MRDFIRTYLRLRDGNHNAGESWLLKNENGKPPMLELSFVTYMDEVGRREMEQALLDAAASGAVYAKFHFRYQRPDRVFIACDGLLDSVLLPLKRLGVIGTCAPPYYTDPKVGAWSVELFPIDAVPVSAQARLTPEMFFAMLFGTLPVSAKKRH
jgi:hypothetical protein